MPTHIENFAAATISHRLRAGITPEVLAAKAGVSTTTIFNLENAQANPTLSTMEAVANALKLSLPEMLLNGITAKEIPSPKHSWLAFLIHKVFHSNS